LVIGAEVFGAHSAKSDAELIAITHSLWQNLGLKNITLEINTLGSNEARANYRSVLVDYFTQHKDQLDEDSTRRLKTNPLRILDSKNKDLQPLIEAAPKLIGGPFKYGAIVIIQSTHQTRVNDIRNIHAF
jgi:histidyl-tRNA synthetase